MTLFVALCPDEVVQEHLSELQKVVSSTWQDAPGPDEPDEVIEVEAHEVAGDDK